MRFDPMTLMGNNPLLQQNNPMMMAINAMRNGGNPNALMQQMLQSNPQLQQIAAGKSPDQLMSIAENMCKERGTSIDAVLKQFGITR